MNSGQYEDPATKQSRGADSLQMVAKGRAMGLGKKSATMTVIIWLQTPLHDRHLRHTAQAPLYSQLLEHVVSSFYR